MDVLICQVESGVPPLQGHRKQTTTEWPVKAPGSNARIYSNDRNSYISLDPCARRSFELSNCFSSFSLSRLFQFNASFLFPWSQYKTPRTKYETILVLIGNPRRKSCSSWLNDLFEQNLHRGYLYGNTTSILVKCWAWLKTPPGSHEPNNTSPSPPRLAGFTLENIHMHTTIRI